MLIQVHTLFCRILCFKTKKANLMKGSDYIKYKFSFKNVKYLTYCNSQIKILNTVNANKITVIGLLFIFIIPLSDRI